MWLAAFLSRRLPEPIRWQFRNPSLGSGFREKSAQATLELESFLSKAVASDFSEWSMERKLSV